MSENELFEDFMRDIPPYPRLPKDGTREVAEFAIQSIDVKVEKLKMLGLRPHPVMLEYRQELTDQLINCSTTDRIVLGCLRVRFKFDD